MTQPLLDFSQSEIAVDGTIFRGEVSARIKDAIGREVGKATKDGRRMVVEKLNTRPAPSAAEQRRAGRLGRGRTGFTASSIEVVHEPANSLYGKIRVKPDIKRPGNTDPRVPYIVTAILENGRRGGSRTRRINVNLKSARSRSRWQAGARVQRPVYMFRYAARELRKRVPVIVERALQRGLK